MEWIGEYNCCDEDPFGNFLSNVVGSTSVIFARELAVKSWTPVSGSRSRVGSQAKPVSFYCSSNEC